MSLHKTCKYNSLIALSHTNRDFFIVHGTEIFFFTNFGAKDLYIAPLVVTTLQSGV